MKVRVVKGGFGYVAEAVYPNKRLNDYVRYLGFSESPLGALRELRADIIARSKGEANSELLRMVDDRLVEEYQKETPEYTPDDLDAIDRAERDLPLPLGWVARRGAVRDGYKRTD